MSFHLRATWVTDMEGEHLQLVDVREKWHNAVQFSTPWVSCQEPIQKCSFFNCCATSRFIFSIILLMITSDKRYNIQEMDKVAYGKEYIKIDKGKWNQEGNLQRVRSMRKWEASVLDVCTLMTEYRWRIEGSALQRYLPYPLW